MIILWYNASVRRELHVQGQHHTTPHDNMHSTDAVGSCVVSTFVVVATAAVVVWAVRRQLNRSLQARFLVTAELLSKAIQPRGKPIDVQRVEFESIAECGSGASTCDRLRLKIVCASLLPTVFHFHPLCDDVFDFCSGLSTVI